MDSNIPMDKSALRTPKDIPLWDRATLSGQVAELERKYGELSHLAGTVLATLAVNRQAQTLITLHNDQQSLFDSWLKVWQEQYDLITKPLQSTESRSLAQPTRLCAETKTGGWENERMQTENGRNSTAGRNRNPRESNKI